MWTLAPHPPPAADFVFGLSLGHVTEPTALTVLRRELALDAQGKPIQDADGNDVYNFACVGLERFQIGTSYPAIAEAVAAKLALPALATAPGQNPPRLALEITGVGHAVADFFIDANLPADIFVITSTGGVEVIRGAWTGRSGWAAAAPWYRVPKQDLVAVVQASLQAERLKIAGTMPLAPTLRRELLQFRATPARADELSGRECVDDDMVFAVAAALWVGTRHVWDWSKPLFY
jgi:hypothetical protein